LAEQQQELLALRDEVEQLAQEKNQAVDDAAKVRQNAALQMGTLQTKLQDQTQALGTERSDRKKMMDELNARIHKAEARALQIQTDSSTKHSDLDGKLREAVSAAQARARKIADAISLGWLV
jgi:hypothetical protein